MNDPKLLPFAAALRRPDPVRVAEFAEAARRLQRERAASEDVVTSALRETPRTAWPRLRERRELQTSGALERLGQEVERRLDRDPREALAVAELATLIADSLAPQSYPGIIIGQLRAHAWKDRGQALSYLGRYDEALRAFDRAEEPFEHFGSLAHDQAVVRFCRAILLQHVRKFDEAQAMLDEARAVFNAHGDTQLYVKCTLATGNLLVRRGDYRGAREVLAPLVEATPIIAAKTRIALGWCAIQLGDASDAIRHFDEATRSCRQLGVELEAVRATYGTGSALLRLHRFEDAITTFRSTREVFLAHGLIEEGGLSGLGIVEAQLVLGHVRAARDLASAIVREFTVADLNRRAVAALAYLNDAIAASSATPEVVRDVHAYIHALRDDPTREFARAN